jgi:hypothetical protein
MAFDNWNIVVDSTALAALVPPVPVNPGTKVWNAKVGAYFTYTISTAALSTDYIVAVAGITGARWVLDGDWHALQRARMKTLVPALTKFQSVKPGANPLSATTGAVTGDANVEGGGISPANASSRSFGTTIFQTTKSQAWAIAFRFQLNGPTTGKSNWVGIINAAGTHDVAIASVFATDNTKLVLEIDGAATTNVVSTFVNDQLQHDGILAFDKTTISMTIDGATVASTTTLTNLVDEAMMSWVFNTTHGDAIVADIEYGFVG